MFDNGDEICLIFILMMFLRMAYLIPGKVQK
jgi:hypothetical protein